MSIVEQVQQLQDLKKRFFLHSVCYFLLYSVLLGIQKIDAGSGRDQGGGALGEGGWGSDKSGGGQVGSFSGLCLSTNPLTLNPKLNGLAS